MKVTIGWRRQGINRHKNPLGAVQRAKHLFAELWTRGDIAVVSTEASARCLRLLLRSSLPTGRCFTTIGYFRYGLANDIDQMLSHVERL